MDGGALGQFVADPLKKGRAVFSLVLVVTPRVEEVKALAYRAEKINWVITCPEDTIFCVSQHVF